MVSLLPASNAAPSSSAAFQAAQVRGAPAHRYRAFISYSHSDTHWARWLMRRLESYRVPARFHGRIGAVGPIGPRLTPIFRDRDELPTTSDLGATIRDALRDSAALIVICSPRSARSRWVNEEILAFKRLGRSDSVFAFIVEGEPKVAGAADDCFPPALRAELGPDGNLGSEPAEVVAADARRHGDGRALALVRLLAGLLRVGFDDLRQRELQRRNRRLTAVAAGTSVGMALMFGLAIVAWQARNDARRRQEQAEGVLTFMLGEFRDELKKLGRLKLLERVGEKSMEYFDSLDPRDLTDTALASQARALTQIGETRLQEASYPAAAQAFTAAYARAAALAARHPRDGAMLFERAQAEFWISAVHRRQGMTTAEADWLRRYRDTTVALVALDPANLKWQQELASGEHNLAVILLEAGDFASARMGFERKLATLRRMLPSLPQDHDLAYRVSDTLSWLGTTAERSGDFGAAIAHFRAEAATLAELQERDPGNAKWRFERADSLSFQAALLAITGERASAVQKFEEAKAIADALVRHDPANRHWQRSALYYRLRLAALALASGEISRATELLGTARAGLETFLKAAPTDRIARGQLAQAWRLESERLLAAGDPPAAADAAAQSVRLGEALLEGGKPVAAVVAETAAALALQASLASRNGDTGAAQRHALRALQILAPPLETSRDWRLLDPGVRARHFSGDTAGAQRLFQRLTGIGYQPLSPWPAGLSPTTASR
ncbi:MAG: toll/interleukin-1 receptor domain-containing protein [Verrucomicrobia bacterium]|nr:toll/interleukin-1 receptor domain-containing protein [Verrucomicrobiota bacterium]